MRKIVEQRNPLIILSRILAQSLCLNYAGRITHDCASIKGISLFPRLIFRMVHPYHSFLHIFRIKRSCAIITLLTSELSLLHCLYRMTDHTPASMSCEPFSVALVGKTGDTQIVCITCMCNVSLASQPYFSHARIIKWAGKGKSGDYSYLLAAATIIVRLPRAALIKIMRTHSSRTRAQMQLTINWICLREYKKQ